jgi:hypothetical protein
MRGLLAAVFILCIVFVGIAMLPTPSPQSPQADLEAGRVVFDRWNDPVLRADVRSDAVSLIIKNLEKASKSHSLYETAQKAADVLRPIRDQAAAREEAIKKAEDAKAEVAKLEAAKKAALDAKLASDAKHKPRVGGAPPGDAAKVALRIILANFDPPDCPQIQSALRMGDGGIHAVCTNREIYRVFTVDGKAFALRCSAMRRLGLDAC